MDNEIIVSLLSSTTSVVAAGFAWLQAARATKRTSDTSVQIAQMNADIDRRKRALEVATSEARPAEDALDMAWRDLQTIKEIAAKVNAVHEFDREKATHELRLAINRLAAGYAEHGSHLPMAAQQAWHQAKSAAAAAGLVLLRDGHVVAAGTRKPESVQSLRDELTERQATIFNERHNLRERFTRRVMELL